VATLTLHSAALWTAIAGRPQPFAGSDPVIFAKTTLCTTGFTTLVWLAVTFLTDAEPGETLAKFYRKVRPQITGWRPVAQMCGDGPVTRDLGRNLVSWIVGCVLVYSTLFSIGEICFGRYAAGAALGAVAIACGVTIWRLVQGTAAWQEI
jgi:hypothetical protein